MRLRFFAFFFTRKMEEIYKGKSPRGSVLKHGTGENLTGYICQSRRLLGAGFPSTPRARRPTPLPGR